MTNEPEKPEMLSDEEIEARFSKIKENLTMELDDADEKLASILDKTHAPKLVTDEFDEKLKALEIKAQAMKEKREAQKVQAEKEVRASQESTQGLGMGLTIMYTILGVPLAGALVGLALNKATGGNAWLPIFGMGGMILGIAYSIVLLYRQNGK